MDPIWFSKALPSRVVASRDSQPAGRQAAPQQHLTPPWTARQEGGESLTSLPSHSILAGTKSIVQSDNLRNNVCHSNRRTKIVDKQFKFDTYRRFFFLSAFFVVFLEAPHLRKWEAKAAFLPPSAGHDAERQGCTFFLSVFRAGW